MAVQALHTTRLPKDFFCFFSYFLYFVLLTTNPKPSSRSSYSDYTASKPTWTPSPPTRNRTLPTTILCRISVTRAENSRKKMNCKQATTTTIMKWFLIHLIQEIRKYYDKILFCGSTELWNFLNTGLLSIKALYFFHAPIIHKNFPSFVYYWSFFCVCRF